MPLLPAELFFYSFPGEIDCPNPECANSLTCRKDKHGEYINPLLSGLNQEAPISTHNNGGVDSDTNPNNLSSFAGSSANNSLLQARPSNANARAVGPLETESNLNYADDH